jgi:hypothetical protein
MPASSAWNSPAGRILDAACAEALAAARWDQADLSTRWPGPEAGPLLLAKAAECALSPVGRDQLLSLAIERVLGEDDREARLLDWETDPDERARIARQVFAFGPNRASETDALVELVESRHARRVHGRTAPTRLAAHLREDAVLHEVLWDHPGIPAGHHIRLAMLCAIPRLRDRADELTTRRPGWLGDLKLMLRSARDRRTP